VRPDSNVTDVSARPGDAVVVVVVVVGGDLLVVDWRVVGDDRVVGLAVDGLAVGEATSKSSSSSSDGSPLMMT